MKEIDEIKINRIISHFFNGVEKMKGLHRDIDYHHIKTNELIFYLSWSNDEVVIYCDDIEQIIGIEYNMLIHNSIASLFDDYNYKYKLVYGDQYYSIDEFFNRL